MIECLSVCWLLSCVEEVEIQQQETPALLVVEATLTDEVRTQSVRLTRAFPFGQDSIPAETGARVSIRTEGGQTVNFRHTGDGIYLSDREFAAESDTAYELQIITPDGTVYSSDPERLPGTAVIDDLYPVREPNQNGTDGVFIYLDSSPGQGNPTYYRYEYEETYKIVAPNYSPLDFLLVDNMVSIVPRTEEQEVCYQTVPSSSVIQNDVTTLASPNIRRFPVRFLGATDFMIRERYSILVRQYVQSSPAFSYFQALKQFSSSETIFNNVQPGFLNGNIRAGTAADAPVIGYFELASVSERRMFFNFEEVFPELESPPYIVNCVPASSQVENDDITQCPASVLELVRLGEIAYVGINTDSIGSCPGPWVYVRRVCGDCTELGSNEVPEFWID